jgi:hypothetical protein
MSGAAAAAAAAAGAALGSAYAEMLVLRVMESLSEAGGKLYKSNSTS